MRVLYLLTGIIIMASCKKEWKGVNEPERYVSGNFAIEFEAFWNGMNNNYAFWDIDKTNWDEMYRKYKPLFAQLNINKEDDQRKSVAYFKEMLANISDGHFGLGFYASALEDSSFSPADLRKMKEPDHHAPLPLQHFMTIIPDRYLDAGYMKSADDELPMVYGTIRNKILYFRFSEFFISFYFFEPILPSKVYDIATKFFEDLKNLPPGIKGIVIDVRNNGGGALVDKNTLLSRLTDKPVKLGSIRYKSGNGRLDYTPWMDAVINPHKDSRPIPVPIIVLGDAYSVSMAELTVMMIKSMPNGKFVGERTWGGHGVITDQDNFNAGGFNTAFLNVYMGSSMLRYKDGNIYEGVGVPPDVEVKYDKAAFDAGKDVQLEKAISLIP